MRSNRLISAVILSSLALAATGCDQFKNKPQPQYGSLTQRLTMVDADGKYYGTVELDPINGGKILDNQGRLIGRVVTAGPDTGALPPAALPPATAQ